MNQKIHQNEIIQNALTLVRKQQKPEIPSLSSVSKRLNVTHAAIYQYFQNKQDLWISVAAFWFEQSILDNISLPLVPDADTTNKDRLHEWLWQLVNLKRQMYLEDPNMFFLHQEYIDANPLILESVLKPAYAQINSIMSYDDVEYERASTIMSAFSIFLLPTFKETWFNSNYENKFNQHWKLIKNGL